MNQQMTDVLKRIVAMPYGDPTCEAGVVRDGHEDGCGKPATAIVRTPWDGTTLTYPTCTYHAHMLGSTAAVPLSEILRAVSDER